MTKFKVGDVVRFKGNFGGNGVGTIVHVKENAYCSDGYTVYTVAFDVLKGFKGWNHISLNGEKLDGAKDTIGYWYKMCTYWYCDDSELVLLNEKPGLLCIIKEKIKKGCCLHGRK